jgi:hypothetical protein
MRFICISLDRALATVRNFFGWTRPERCGNCSPVSAWPMNEGNGLVFNDPLAVQITRR